MAQLLRLLRKKFEPTDISGLALWLDARDASTLALSGSSVTQWNDKSGKGNHVVQGTGANQPDYLTSGINALPAVSFSAANKNLAVADNATFDHGPQIDVFVVAQRDTDTGGLQSPISKYNGSTIVREFFISVNSSDVWALTASTTGASGDIIIASATTATLGQGFVVECGHNSTAGFVSINGGAFTYGPGSVGIVNSDSALTLGRVSGGDFYGKVSEVLFYTRCLNVAERAEVTAYLKSKWRIA